MCAHISVERQDKVNEARMKSMKEHFSKEYADYTISCEIIRHENVVQGLQEYIEKNEIDMIEMRKIKNKTNIFFRPLLYFQTSIYIFIRILFL